MACDLGKLRNCIVTKLIPFQSHSGGLLLVLEALALHCIGVRVMLSLKCKMCWPSRMLLLLDVHKTHKR